MVLYVLAYEVVKQYSKTQLYPNRGVIFIPHDFIIVNLTDIMNSAYNEAKLPSLTLVYKHILCASIFSGLKKIQVWTQDCGLIKLHV